MPSRKVKFAGAAAAVLALAALIVAVPGIAQQPGQNEGAPPAAGSDGQGRPPGAPEGGPASPGAPEGRGGWMGRHGWGGMGMRRMGRVCDERLTRFAQRRLERIEQ